MRLPLLTTISLLCIHTGYSQTFTGTGGDINDNQTTEFTLPVSGLPTAINATTFGLETVCIDIIHTYDEDLDIRLVAPDGTITWLVQDNGGGDDNYTNTCFDTYSTTSIYNGSAPFTGTFKPDQNFASMNNGQNPNGNWKLRITDDENNDDGQVLSWKLTFGNNPAQFSENADFDLPLVVINTFGVGIPDEPKINAHMGIIDNGPGNVNRRTDPFNNYNNRIGIEQRGSSSSGFPQKSYGFETKNVNGITHDTILLGMPAENDWILYAPYNDKTCMRNILSYHIANATGHYASRTKLVEVILNNSYRGIYVIMEKIKRNEARVDIAKLNPDEIDGDDVTGGYIIKVDRDEGAGTYWPSSYQSSAGKEIRFCYDTPKPEDIAPQQKSYIQQYMYAFETALKNNPFSDTVIGYRRYVDVPSFIDYFLLNETSKNVDGYRLSTFLHKDKESNGGKLKAGPAWDYNLGWWNADYCEGDLSTGWAYKFNDVCGWDGNTVPFWWDKFLEDEWYQSELKCRWKELRQSTLNITNLETFIDSVATLMYDAKQRHFNKWTILNTYTWPNPSPIPADFAGEITALKTWIHDRFEWMDANLPGICYLGTEEIIREENVRVSPNPFRDKIVIDMYVNSAANLQFTLTNMLGQTVHTFSHDNASGDLHEETDLSHLSLPEGMYLLKISSGKETIVKKIMKGL